MTTLRGSEGFDQIVALSAPGTCVHTTTRHSSPPPWSIFAPQLSVIHHAKMEHVLTTTTHAIALLDTLEPHAT